ncbi:MAG: hypothetical protein RLZZ450_2983 [Pseudomonadota bacterium]|jgi:predicted nucleic acid-binding protein
MVLIDTSAWVRMFHGRQPYRRAIEELLDEGEVLGHELVYGELMIGDAGARAKPLLTYSRLSYAATVPHVEVAQLVRARRLFGRGIGWIDAHLLAATMAAKATLYTADGPLQELAAELGVAHLAAAR